MAGPPRRLRSAKPRTLVVGRKSCGLCNNDRGCRADVPSLPSPKIAVVLQGSFGACADRVERDGVLAAVGRGLSRAGQMAPSGSIARILSHDRERREIAHGTLSKGLSKLRLQISSHNPVLLALSLGALQTNQKQAPTGEVLASDLFPELLERSHGTPFVAADRLLSHARALGAKKAMLSPARDRALRAPHRAARRRRAGAAEAASRARAGGRRRRARGRRCCNTLAAGRRRARSGIVDGRCGGAVEPAAPGAARHARRRPRQGRERGGCDRAPQPARRRRADRLAPRRRQRACNGRRVGHRRRRLGQFRHPLRPSPTPATTRGARW